MTEAKDTGPVTLYLDVLDRLKLLDLLPKNGTYVTLVESKAAQKAVNLSLDEIKEFECVPFGEGGMRWNEKGQEHRPITLTSFMHTTMVDILKARSEKKELAIQELSIYDQIVNGNYPKDTIKEEKTNEAH